MNLNRLRLRATWVLVVPFFWFARPTPGFLAAGGAVSLLGLVVRGWAAGTIRKNERLATGGPYAFTRNPLYLGSFLIGLGLTLTAGVWVWPVAFLVFFPAAYVPLMARESDQLRARFRDEFEAYERTVPGFVPRVRRPTSRLGDPAPFRLSQYRRNREWEAALGVTAAFAILATKAWLN